MASRIAIVGTGISGLVCAHRLHAEHDITVFEAEDRVGGHTNTVRVDAADGTHWVDTGFIVYNDRNYPNFEPLLAELGVATQKSRMSFSVSDGDGGFEYSGSPRGLFAQPGNASTHGSCAWCATWCASTARCARCWSSRPTRGRRCVSSWTPAATASGSPSG